MKKTILITGAHGLIGSAIVRRLRAEDRYNVVEGTRDWCDVTQPIQGDTQYHYIIHAASNAAPKAFAETPVDVMMANILGVRNLMEYGRTHGMERFLFVSTGEVYGEGDGRVFTEDYQGFVDITSPRSCYPSSKRAAETLCAAYAKQYGIDYVVARPCHIYGPDFTRNDNRVYAQFIRNVMRGEDIVMKSTGEQMRSWCYVEDCVSALLTILEHGTSGEAYNIADENSNISIRQLAEMIAEIGGKHVVIDLPSDAERSGYNPVTQSLFSTEKLQSLGWTITGTMKEKMQETISRCARNEGLVAHW